MARYAYPPRSVNVDTTQKPKRLSLLAVAGLWLTLAGCSEPTRPAPAKAPPGTSETASDGPSASTVHVDLPQHGFAIDVPPGFEERGGLLYWPEYRASIGFAFAPDARYDAVAAEFTPEVLKSAGFTLVERSEVSVNDTTGVLVRLSGDRDQKEVWTLAFPSAGGTAQVQATFSKSIGEPSEPFRAALLTVTHHPPN
ncbi:MAG TPA: hypothetical protein VF170_08005 [Planctomycetaceae bacterium]